MLTASLISHYCFWCCILTALHFFYLPSLFLCCISVCIHIAILSDCCTTLSPLLLPAVFFLRPSFFLPAVFKGNKQTPLWTHPSLSLLLHVFIMFLCLFLLSFRFSSRQYHGPSCTRPPLSIMCCLASDPLSTTRQPLPYSLIWWLHVGIKTQQTGRHSKWSPVPSKICMVSFPSFYSHPCLLLTLTQHMLYAMRRTTRCCQNDSFLLRFVCHPFFARRPISFVCPVFRAAHYLPQWHLRVCL